MSLQHYEAQLRDLERQLLDARRQKESLLQWGCKDDDKLMQADFEIEMLSGGINTLKQMISAEKRKLGIN